MYSLAYTRPLNSCLKALGLGVNLIAASDCKSTAQKFVKQNLGYKHMFKDVGAHIEGKGVCAIHSSEFCQQTCTTAAEDRHYDLVMAGIPCHPFTHIRQKTSGATSRRKGSAEEHPDFGTVFDGFPKFLATVKPSAFIAEETDAFLDRPDEGGPRYVDTFVEKVQALGYRCHALMLDGGDWCEWPRMRLSVGCEIIESCGVRC